MHECVVGRRNCAACPLTGQFTVPWMRALEERIREIAVGHIEAMKAAGTEADLVPAYALPIPSPVICELLGVDYGERDRSTPPPLPTSGRGRGRSSTRRRWSRPPRPTR